MRKDVAKITNTKLGYEDHGILTCMLIVNYGNTSQGVGGYALDAPLRDENDRFLRRNGTAFGMEFVARVIKACGVETWEEVKGRTVYVLQDLPEGSSALGTSKVIGIENLPTEPGKQFIFQDLVDEFETRVEA